MGNVSACTHPQNSLSSTYPPYSQSHHSRPQKYKPYHSIHSKHLSPSVLLFPSPPPTQSVLTDKPALPTYHPTTIQQSAKHVLTQSCTMPLKAVGSALGCSLCLEPPWYTFSAGQSSIRAAFVSSCFVSPILSFGLALSNFFSANVARSNAKGSDGWSFDCATLLAGCHVRDCSVFGFFRSLFFPLFLPSGFFVLTPKAIAATSRFQSFSVHTIYRFGPFSAFLSQSFVSSIKFLGLFLSSCWLLCDRFSFR